MKKFSTIFLLLSMALYLSLETAARSSHSPCSSSGSASSSSSSSESSESKPCADSSSSESKSDSDSDSKESDHKHRNSKSKHHDRHRSTSAWKWNLDEMSSTEVQELTVWAELHQITFEQIKACNDYYVQKFKSNRKTHDQSSDVIYLCGVFGTSLPEVSNTIADSDEDKGSLEALKSAVRIITMFDEYKRADNIRDALLKLKSMCTFVKPPCQHACTESQ